MNLDLHDRPFNWREKTVQLASELERAHATMEELGAALDRGDDASARDKAQSAHDAVGSVGYAVKALHSEQPPAEQLDKPDAIGSTLAIGGSGVATIALDVMVSAMLALAATDDGRRDRLPHRRLPRCRERLRGRGRRRRGRAPTATSRPCSTCAGPTTPKARSRCAHACPQGPTARP